MVCPKTMHYLYSVFVSHMYIRAKVTNRSQNLHVVTSFFIIIQAFWFVHIFFTIFRLLYQYCTSSSKIIRLYHYNIDYSINILYVKAFFKLTLIYQHNQWHKTIGLIIQWFYVIVFLIFLDFLITYLLKSICYSFQ